ncbi:MAG TPA: LysR family transcriptional regulator [Polyangiaceae bacterium]
MIELTELRYFKSVAVTESFSLGAKASHVSPPAMSKAIKKLEEELGVALFVRTTRRVALTQHGEVLLAQASRVLEQVDALRQAMDDVQGAVRGDLRIGAMEVFSNHLLPAALARLVRAHPQVVPRSYEMLPERMEHLVTEGALDVAFTIGGGSSREIHYHPLGRSPGALVCGRTHALYRKARVTPRTLRDHPFVVPRFLGMEHMPVLDQYPEDRAARTVGATIELLQMGVELVVEGAYLGYFPEISVRHLLADGRLRIVRGVPSGGPFELRALSRRTGRLKPAAAELIKRLATMC